MGSVTVAMEDVLAVIQQISGYLIGIGAALVLAIIAIVYSSLKLKRPLKGLVNGEAVIAFLLVTVLLVNLMLNGPLYNTLNTVLADSREVSAEAQEASRQLVEEITAEGIVLAKNNGGLPLDPGSLNNGQDWSLPEPTADSYSQELMDSARDFSDWAIVVLARSGGEGADLPHDMGKVLDGSVNTELRDQPVVAQGSYWEGTKYTNALYTPNSEDYADFEYGQHYLELSRTERDLMDLVTSNFNNVIVVYNGANTMEMGWTEDYEQIKSVLLCAGPGATGFNALGQIIAGEVNPSGRTVDLWPTDLTAAPWYNNIGHFNYTDADSQAIAAAAQEVWPRADGYVTFVDYVEVVYTGDNAHNGDVDTAVSRFDFAEGDVNYLSRAGGFANYAQATAAPTNFDRPTTVYANGSWDPADHNDPGDEVPTTGASGSVRLAGLRGADFDIMVPVIQTTASKKIVNMVE